LKGGFKKKKQINQKNSCAAWHIPRISIRVRSWQLVNHRCHWRDSVKTTVSINTSNPNHNIKSKTLKDRCSLSCFHC